MPHLFISMVFSILQLAESLVNFSKSNIHYYLILLFPTWGEQTYFVP